MPLYSLIALTLSLFGATYTVIAALRSHFDKNILSSNESIGDNLEGIKSAGEHSETLTNAKRHAGVIRRWTFCWRWSHYIPIGSFWFFTFLIAGLCIYNWDDITLKVGALPSGSQGFVQPPEGGFFILKQQPKNAY